MDSSLIPLSFSNQQNHMDTFFISMQRSIQFWRASAEPKIRHLIARAADIFGVKYLLIISFLQDLFGARVMCSGWRSIQLNIGFSIFSLEDK